MKNGTRNRLALLFLVLVLPFLLWGPGLSSPSRTNDPAPPETVGPPPENVLLARFPFEFDGRILVPVGINESRPVNVILDTGFGQRALLLMHKETGEDLGLTYVRTVPAIRGAGSGKNKDAHITPGERLSLPGLDLGKVATAVVDESRDVSPQHNLGVIGGAVFIPYVVEIDFEDGLISLFDPTSYSPPEGWEEIPLAFEKNLPVLETTVRIGGGKPIPVRLIVDTGGKPSLALARDDERTLEPPPRVVHFLSGTGFRGDVFSDHGRLSELRIGGHTLKNVVSAFWKGDEAPFLEEGNVDGPLGLGTLYRFDMIFDYTRARMFIRPNRYYADPFEMNMAGMALEETVSGDMTVYYVMEGSEAAKKGLRKGDVLVEAEKKEVGLFGFLEIRRLFERDGGAVTVKIRRNGEIREVVLELKRII